MSNAAKLKKKAAEFEQKKQFDKALQLYIQILDEGEGDDAEGDVALYNRVGDLLMRQGNVGDAMTYYEKAVDLYAESGFFNNAIALCNKILRQSPGRNSVYYKLGKISAKKGFISDAKQNFLEYASRMQGSGHLDEAFRALKEFADLCPDQDDIRLMLADQLSRKDRKGEALEQLQLLYEKFEVEGRGDEMRATVDRMRAIDPAAEPKAGGGPRSQKSADLIFLDLSDDKGGKPAHSRGDVHKPRASAPTRRSGESRTTAPVRVEPEVVDAADDLQLPNDIVPSAAAPSDHDDLLPLPPLDEADAMVDGLESTTQFVAADPKERESVRGLESSAFDDELSQALDAALPDVEPPLSGQQFAALRLATPLSVPALMPPEHDLALPGELPVLGSTRSMLSLTGEMELIIPDGDVPSTAARSGSRDGPSGTDGARARATGQPSGADFLGEAASLRASDKAADTKAPDRRLGARAPGVDGLSFVGGADLLDVPEPLPPPEPRGDRNTSPTAKRAVERTSGPSPEIDELADLPEWLDNPTSASANGAARASESVADILSLPKPDRRSGETSISHSPLARSADALRARVEAEPLNWTLRQQLAEALLDSGDREGGIQVLEGTMVGFERAQDLEAARSVADEIIRLMPNSVRHHQKRVEYAFRTSDRSRLPQAYLELADALFRSGQADKARAVYQRVLELSPDDARAQAALSTFGEEFIEPLDEPDEPLLVDPPRLAEPALRPARHSRGLAFPAAPIAPVMPAPSAIPLAPTVPAASAAAASSAAPAPAAPAPAAATVPPAPAAAPSAPRPPANPRPGKAPGRLPLPGRPDAAADSSRVPSRPEPARPDPRPGPRQEPKPALRGGLRPGARPEIRPPGRPNLPSAHKAPGKAPPAPTRVPPPAPPEAPDPAPKVEADAKAAPPPAELARSGDQYVNLGDWLRDAEPPRSTRMVIDDEKPTGDEAADFADMLRRFKQGIAENVAEEDHDSHYDLGVAYKEMGLIDEAVAEFQKALRAPQHRVRTYEALGQCFIEKQQFQVAATILSRALDEPGVTDDQLVGVLYLLGYASEALMHWEAALGYYQRVFAVDIRFRDAAQRLAQLERSPQ